MISEMKIIHLNIRSVNKNLASAIASNIFHENDIVVLTECWLSPISIPPLVNGFNHYSTPSKFGKAGGIIIYIRPTILCTFEKTHLTDESSEMLTIKLL